MIYSVNLWLTKHRKLQNFSILLLHDHHRRHSRRHHYQYDGHY